MRTRECSMDLAEMANAAISEVGGCACFRLTWGSGLTWDHDDPDHYRAALLATMRLHGPDHRVFCPKHVHYEVNHLCPMYQVYEIVQGVTCLSSEPAERLDAPAGSFC